jgi:hypothetical protein
MIHNRTGAGCVLCNASEDCALTTAIAPGRLVGGEGGANWKDTLHA